MFISFFTGKVMLFYGITLIMKEKSNASALRPRIDNLSSFLAITKISFKIIVCTVGVLQHLIVNLQQ